ncbi:terminase small subunit [Marinobacter sp. 71-i]|uniref:Terminase small subunit n=1 Tax=Marinobacter iranensis TaxID=2962607 RepID=A0ABT5Y9P6_9GAMM|nr:terminase small subunit [Marinobacter iranensis]MDF0750289.1 terminase small subunit [Marinobacter iranensis]
MQLSPNPRESTKAKMREFADLYRGGPEKLRGNSAACYGHLHPKAALATCKVWGSEYLNHPYTQAILKERTNAVAEAADITQDRVLREVARIGLFDGRKLFRADGNPIPIHELDDDTAAAIAGVKVRREMSHEGDEELSTVIEYKIADKNSALEKLMKYLGAYEKDNKQKGLLADLPRDMLQLITDKLRDEV